MDRLLELQANTTVIRNESDRKDSIIKLSKALSVEIDAKINLDDKEAVGKLIDAASNWELTVLVGTQINHIIECEPKFCKDLPKDLKHYKDHFKVYQVKHFQNFRDGIRVPTKEQMFL